MTVAVTLDVENAQPAEVMDIARAAEQAGAGYLAVPDTYWWQEMWLHVDRALSATSTLQVGAILRNPYLRHPHHILSRLADLQGSYGNRLVLGLAPRRPTSGAALVMERRDAARIRSFATLVRHRSDGAGRERTMLPLPGVAFQPPALIVEGRDDHALSAGGSVADTVIVSAVPHPDLERATDVVIASAAGRIVPPDLAWAPILVSFGSATAPWSIINAFLNSSTSLQEEWGLTSDYADLVRNILASVGSSAALSLIPARVLRDIVLTHDDIDGARLIANRIGATTLVLRADSAATVITSIDWARSVLESVG